jgi:hypothetical protein
LNVDTVQQDRQEDSKHHKEGGFELEGRRDGGMEGKEDCLSKKISQGDWLRV